jgi:amino acid adenylation domain-containing protein
MSARATAETASQHPDGELADNLYWLSKIDEGIPRAQLVPDFKRSAGRRHAYQGSAFSVDPDVVRILKSIDRTHGVSDLVLCATLLTALFARYHREERLVIGLQTSSDALMDTAVVPLHLVCNGEQAVPALMRTIAEEVASSFDRAPCTASSMAKIMGVDLNESRCPFFDVGLAIGDGAAAFDLETYPVDLAFVFDSSAGLIRGQVLYATDLFHPSTIERVISHFLHAARQISLRPASRLADIDVLGADERSRILAEFRGRSVSFPVDKTLHGRFEEQVRRTPDAVAAIDRDRQLSYAELNSRANRLARTLLSLGLTKGGFVGILLNRGCDFVTAMLAVFKAGGAYVPLDPTYPRDRILYMLDDSQTSFVISNSTLVGAFQDVIAGAEQLRFVLSVEGAIDSVARRPHQRSITVVSPETIASMAHDDVALPLVGTDRAYMIYTSGSTGRPKGAICRHGGALNHLYGELHGLGIDSAFRFLQTAASSSDISVWQFMAPLLFGGATVVVDYDVVIDPEQLFAAIKNHRVSVAELVPVVLRGLIDHVSELPIAARRLSDLRFMMATGEALAAELVDRWLLAYPEIPIANTYGPTETSDDVTLLVLREPVAEKRAIVPIGRPLPNISIFMLDRELRPVPVGVPGEICIGGIGVGEGYWQQPDKTKAAFVPSPFPQLCDGSIYRSGDLGRWLPDGSVEFLGRIDQQVKVRGFRVEPGEIEAVLTRHPAVQDAAVVAVYDSAGNNRLLGYFVARKDQSVATGELRQFLQGALADHMIPAALVPLSALPLTPLGKVDRKALARSEYPGGVERENYVAPRNETERVLAAAWCKVLKQRQVGIDANFFEIGGDSILTIHIIAELKKAGLHVAPKQFFLHPTIAELAAQIHVAKAPTVAPEAGRRMSDGEPQRNLESLRQQLVTTFPDLEDVYPLGATQRGIYFQSILPAKSSGGYIEQIGFELQGDLDEQAFAKAWQQAVSATDVLRTGVVRRGVPQPMQVVLRSASLEPQVQDWRRRSAGEFDSALDALVVEDRRKGFDLAKPPLMRVTLTRLGDKRWHVLWTYHHIILDGWSEPLVLGDVFSAYNSMVGAPQDQAASRVRYRDFVAWSESQDMAKAQDFWRQQLAGFISPVRLKDNSPAVQPAASVELSHGWEEILLTQAETSRLDDVARRNKLTLSTIIHGAWGILLHRRTASEDVVFGSVASGRQCEFPQVESVRGVVVVTQPMRTRLMGDATLASWLRLLQLQMAEIREFEQTPLALIQQWCDVPAEKRPLFDTLVVMANYLGSDLANCRPKGVELSKVAYVTQPLYALTLFIQDGEQMKIRLVYEKRRYALGTVQQLLAEYRQLLIGFSENPEQRLTGRPMPS